MLKKQAERDKIQIGTRPYLYKFEKDRLYLNQNVPGPGQAFGPISTWEVLISTCHVPIGTPRVPTGPLGC